MTTEPVQDPSQETIPTRVSVDPAAYEPEKAPRQRRSRAWLLWVLLCVLLLCGLAGLSGYGGYKEAVQIRQKDKLATQVGDFGTQFAMAGQDLDSGRFPLVATRMAYMRTLYPTAQPSMDDLQLELQVQFELAKREAADKSYESARQRLEWVIEWDPQFPGAAELLADVLYNQSVTATATPRPTPTLTATPDMRDVQKMLGDAQAALRGGAWTSAIETLLTLRKKDPNYYPVQVDGLLYSAYRNRGVDKIRGNGKTDVSIQHADLEGGMYDLKMAEALGPLDVDAQVWQRRAQWYVTGASYWDINWARVVSYFELVAVESPYLYDAGGWPAIERYRKALMRYGDFLAANGDCEGAKVQYQKALDLGPNPTLEPTATAVAESCGGGDAPPGEVTPTLTETPTPGA